MYKKGGKKPKNKSSFMEESKEIKFGGMSYKNGGLYSAAEKAENIAKVKKMNSQQSPEHQTQVKKKTGGPDDPPAAPPADAKTNETPKSGSDSFYELAKISAQASPRNARKALKQAAKVEVAKATGTRKGSKIGEALVGAGAALTGAANVVNSVKPTQQKTGGKHKGDKSMEPGGGGRFAALVNKLKGKGKSEDSAKAIAASVGRKKYGKSKFQEMAAKGKKGLGGMSDSTSANDAGMGMMESMGTMEAMDKGKRKKNKAGSGARHAADVRRRQQQRTKVARRNIGNCRRGPNGQTICD